MLATELTDGDFRRFSALVYKTCGISLNEGKKELVRARLGKRLRQTGHRNFRNYYKFVTDGTSADELVRFVDSICTNTTSFFREQKHFDFLKQEVFPGYLADKNGKGPRRLRLWSAGCSSGEEPYSLAIWLSEYFGNTPGFDVKILATDISSKVLALAERAVYRAERVVNMPKLLLRKYFQRGHGSQEGYFRVKPLLRKMIEFKRFNFMERFTFRESFDLILCRNVMIYFDKTTQEALVNKFYDALRPRGYLFTGHSETLTGIEHRFTYVKPSVYQKR